MQPNPEATHPAGDAAARTLFAAKPAVPAVEKFESDNIPAKKRGTFLTRRFFGSIDKKDTARTEDTIGISPDPANLEAKRPDQPKNDPMMSETEPRREQPVAPAVSFPEPTLSDLPVSGTPGGLAHGLNSDPTMPAETQPIPTSTVAGAPRDIPAPEVHAPTPLVNPPAGDATNFPKLRMTVPSSYHPQPIMTPTQTTGHTPAVERASAQLTLGFEITSLQLTPFFRLGSVQLKSLSNVVSLGLVVARQVDPPFAAGISFQIERVELDGAARLASILIKPLRESREVAVPLSRLQVDRVAVNGEGEDAPISVMTSGAASTAVQLIGTFAIAAMEFSPAFEIDSLRLEPVSNTVLLRVAPSSGTNAQDLPSSFEIAEMQLGDDALIRGARLVPGTARNA